MAGANPNILYDSVRFILSNWTALQLAVEHGFGGADGREKAEWLVSVVDQVLRENDTIEVYELEDYIGEILFNEFNTMAEDGSLHQVVQNLCDYHRLWKEGNVEQIRQQISSPVVKQLPKFVKEEASENGSDPSDNDSEDGDVEETGAQAICNGYHEDYGNNSTTLNQRLDLLHTSENGTPQHLNNSTTEMRETSCGDSQMQTDEEEEGWEIVRRSKRR
ncbi:pre-rRNA-processing protein TSR2 homolog [Montipora foliosa]|uniref:pre-rRNA-processing protein TSR2 homolog n=1 Tax=Montipora foliosa TaxID=591990 RepID=UPI0035F16F61